MAQAIASEGRLARSGSTIATIKYLSITTITNGGNGTVIAINAYDAYGIGNDTNIGRFQYTGQAWLEELGMYHYKARIYSPTLGRFMQTDPIGYEDNINLYAYVGNDPVGKVDPEGEQGRRAAHPGQSNAMMLVRAQYRAVLRSIRNSVPDYKTRASIKSPTPSYESMSRSLDQIKADSRAISVIGYNNFQRYTNGIQPNEGINNSNATLGRIQTAFSMLNFQRTSSSGTYNFEGGAGGLRAAESFVQSFAGNQIRSTPSGGNVYSLSGLPSGTTGKVSVYYNNKQGYARASVQLTTTYTETISRIHRTVKNEFKVVFSD